MRVDAAVVDAAISGEPAALEILLAKSIQDLRRYAEYHCEVNDIEDAVQEVCLIVSKHIKQLRVAAALTSWSFRILKRTCVQMKRSNRMITNNEEGFENTLVFTPTYNELRIEISKAMSAIPKHYRQILLMRDIDGRTLKEIAATLDLTIEATKSRLHRARALIRDVLDGEIMLETGHSKAA